MPYVNPDGTVKEEVQPTPAQDAPAEQPQPAVEEPKADEPKVDADQPKEDAGDGAEKEEAPAPAGDESQSSDAE